jgi:hypothetical protein
LGGGSCPWTTGRATGEFSRVAAAGIERIREMCAARCTKGFVDGGRATREFSRVAVPWRGKLKVAADFRYGVWAGDAELAWKNVHVGSQRLLLSDTRSDRLLL